MGGKHAEQAVAQVRAALDATNGVLEPAAEALGVSLRTMHRLLQRTGLATYATQIRIANGRIDNSRLASELRHRDPSAPTVTRRTLTKAAFVLAQPEDMPASEVVAKAKEVGFEMGTRYVSETRSKARAKARASAPARPKPPAVPVTPALQAAPKIEPEAAFQQLVRQLGMAKALTLFAEMQQRIDDAGAKRGAATPGR
jgi:hypothetical protein